MTDFDFTAVKTTVTKTEDIPRDTRVNLTVNPLADHFAKSMKKEDADGNGQWLNMVLPGEETITSKGGVNYGKVVTKALNYLRRAAKEADKGISIRTEDMKDGTVKIFYRSRTRRVVNRSK